MSNFICIDCQKQHTIPCYSYDGSNYKNKLTKEIIKCDCEKHTILTPIKTEWDGGAPFFGKIASMSPTERGEVLKKRAKQNFKKEIRERKIESNRAFNNEVKSMKQ